MPDTKGQGVAKRLLFFQRVGPERNFYETGADQMENKIKVYKINDFIRKTVSGDIDFDKSIEIVHELAYESNFYSGHNILVDMRDTTLGRVNMSTLLQITFEMANYKTFFKKKIASLIPDEPERIKTAENLCVPLLFRI